MIGNLGATTIASLYKALLQFLLNFILAHYVTPAEFGQIALIQPIAFLALLVGDLGLSAAIVRADNFSAKDAGATFIFCLLIGAIAIVLTAAPVLLLGLPSSLHGLEDIAVAFAVVVALALLCIAPKGLLERRMLYTSIGAIEAAASTAGLAAAVGVAHAGHGIWGLPAYHLATQAVRLGVFTYLSRPEMEINISWRPLSALLAVGGWLVAFNLVNYFGRNGGNYIIGGVLGTGDLGTFAFSYQIMLLPLMIVTWPAAGVLASTLTPLRGKRAETNDMIASVMSLTSVITLPGMGFLAVAAPLYFEMLLPEKWHGVGPVVAWLAIAGALQSLGSYMGTVLLSQGRVQLQFWIGVAVTLIVLAMLWATAAHAGSLLAVAAGYMVFAAVQALVYLSIMCRLLDIAWAPFMVRVLSLGTGATLAGATAVLLCQRLFHLDMLAQAIVLALAYGTAALTVLAAFRKSILADLSMLVAGGKLAKELRAAKSGQGAESA